MDGISFHQVQTREQKAQAGELIREYLTWLNDRVKADYGVEFDIEAMIASDLTDPQKFEPPLGRFYLVLRQGKPAGVGCLKQLQPGIGEIQRMYVAQSCRGLGLGRAIVDRLIAEAGEAGYTKLRLESMAFLTPAHTLYRSVGFKDVPHWDDNSMKSFQAGETLDRYYSNSVYMELDLP